MKPVCFGLNAVNDYASKFSTIHLSLSLAKYIQLAWDIYLIISFLSFNPILKFKQKNDKNSGETTDDFIPPPIGTDWTE